jgi:two-component system, NarL family, response regulator DevR
MPLAGVLGNSESGYLMGQPNRIPERARVILIDDSSFVLEGLQVALSKSNCIVVVGTARTEGEAVALMQACQPDVVVMDVRMGRASGISLCKVVRESFPTTAVLFFTADDDKYTLRSAILAGARGYLLKGASEETIVKSVEAVAAGESVMDRQLTQQLLLWVRDGRQAVQRQRREECSSADLRVLSLVAAGKSNKDIAQELNVTTGIVTTRLRAIYKRLRISRRSEAASYFMRHQNKAHQDAYHTE